MKVTQIFNVYLEKGGEEQCVDLLEAQFKGESAFATMRFDSADWRRPNAPSKCMQALKMYRNRDSLERLRAHEREFTSDVWLLHNLFPVGSSAIFTLAKELGIRTVIVTHNFRPYSVSGYLWANHRVEPAGLKKNFFPEILSGAWRGSVFQTAWYAGLLWALHLRGVYRRVDHWIAISDFMRGTFIGAGISPEKITTLKHAWPIHPVLDRLPEDEGYYLYLGRLVEMKGIRFLVEAWRGLGGAAPLLKICGDGPESGWVRGQAEDHDGIEYCGRVEGEQKQRLLENCRALIVPSLSWETFGLVVYESYEAGKPVLVSAAGALPELVPDGETGLHFRPGDILDFQQKIRQAERSPESLRDMGLRGRAYLEKHGRIEEWKTRLWKILEEVVNQPPDRPS